MTKLELKIEGMTCGSCSKSITTVTSKFDFTSNVEIDHDAGTGKMDIAGDFEANKAKVVDMINRIGYKVVQ